MGEEAAEKGPRSSEKLLASKLIEQCCNRAASQIKLLSPELGERYPLGPGNPNALGLVGTAFTSLPEMVRYFELNPDGLFVRERSVERMREQKLFIGGRDYGEKVIRTQTSWFLENPGEKGVWAPSSGSSRYQLVFIMREPIEKPAGDTEVALRDLITKEIAACRNRVEKVRARGAPVEEVSEVKERQERAIAKLRKMTIEDALVLLNNYYYKDRGTDEPIIDVLRIAGIRLRRSLGSVVIEAVEFFTEREKPFVWMGEFPCSEKSGEGDGDRLWKLFVDLSNGADRQFELSKHQERQ